MTTPITSTASSTTTGRNTISGLGSSIQWGDIVDSTINAQQARDVTPITNELELRAKQKDAWTQLNTLSVTLNDAARAIRRTGFGGYTATVPTSPTTSRALLTAVPSLTAVPGTYRVEVVQLADTARFAGKSVADTGAALGLTGNFTINGATIAIAATDTLVDLQGKLNDANTGVSPTGVSATIVSDGGTAGRLVLSATASGAPGITLSDGTGGIAREIGFLDSRSKPLTSATQAAAMALGLSSTTPATIRVGDTVIVADLSVDSISSIAAKINAAGGSASVEAEQYGDETRYRLVADGYVSAVPGDAGSQAVIDELGFGAGKGGAIKQTVATGAYTSAGNSVATAATALAGLKLDGASTALAVGDAVNIRGYRGDGTAVTIGLVVSSGDTMQTLLDTINDPTTGFGAGARSAAALLGAGGRIRMADSVAGASRLSLSLTSTHADGSTGALGTSTVTNAGRTRELQQGRDAILRVDGRELTRSSNNVSDAIAGVTLSLTAAEPGTSLDVAINRDIDSSVNAVQKFADAYNAIRTFFDTQRAGGALATSSTLRSIVDSYLTALRTGVSSNTTYGSLAVTGVALDRNGLLQVDKSVVKSAVIAKPTEVEALFGFTGVGGAFVTATDAVTSFGNGPISAQKQTADDATARLKSRRVNAQRRLDDRRALLVAQFTKMETAIARLNAQGSTITGSLRSLRG